MSVSEETKNRWAAPERRYAEMYAKKEKQRRSAAMRELDNQERRRIKAEKQRKAAMEAERSAKTTRQPSPAVSPAVVKRREMLVRMGSPIDNPSEIRKAWKRLALLYHPDKCGGQDTKFKSILEAYEFLMK
jgi:hypothetical protein